MQIQAPASQLGFWGASLLHGAAGDLDELLPVLGLAPVLGLGVAFWMARGSDD